MSWIAVGTMAVGAATGAGGAFLKGRSGDIKRKRLENIANTPGLDIQNISRDALANQQKLLPQAQGLVRSEAEGRQNLLNDLTDMSLPGFSEARGRGMEIATDYLNNPFSQEDLRAVQHNSAVQALSGGFGGSSRHGHLLGAKLYDTGQARKQAGLQWLQALRGISPIAQPTSAFAFTGPDANTWLDVRGRERTQKLGMLGQASQIGGQTEAFGDYLSGMGGSIMGMGGGMMGGMGGGGGGGMNVRVPSGSRYTGVWQDSFL